MYQSVPGNTGAEDFCRKLSGRIQIVIVCSKAACLSLKACDSVNMPRTAYFQAEGYDGANGSSTLIELVSLGSLRQACTAAELVSPVGFGTPLINHNFRGSP